MFLLEISLNRGKKAWLRQPSGWICQPRAWWLQPRGSLCEKIARYSPDCRECLSTKELKRVRSHWDTSLIPHSDLILSQKPSGEVWVRCQWGIWQTPHPLKPFAERHSGRLSEYLGENNKQSCPTQFKQTFRRKAIGYDSMYGCPKICVVHYSFSYYWFIFECKYTIIKWKYQISSNIFGISLNFSYFCS